MSDLSQNEYPSSIESNFDYSDAENNVNVKFNDRVSSGLHFDPDFRLESYMDSSVPNNNYYG